MAVFVEQKAILYGKIVETVIVELGNEQLTKGWNFVQQMTQNKDIKEIVMRVSEKKDDFVGMIE